MHREFLLQQINNYAASEYLFEEELIMVKQFIDFVKLNPNCFERTNKGHVTGSAWIVSADNKKALLTHHRKFNIWLQLGGHSDGDSNSAAVALKEAIEESGINNFEFVIPEIFDIDIHPIPSACEYHYDVRYLLKAPEKAEFKISEESLDLAWVDIDKISDYSFERSVIRMNEKYKKLFL